MNETISKNNFVSSDCLSDLVFHSDWLVTSRTLRARIQNMDSMDWNSRIDPRTSSALTTFLPIKGWIALGQALGWVNSHIILGLVFIVVLQPIAYVMRLTGYDPLRKRRKGESSYRENRQDHRTDLTRIF